MKLELFGGPFHGRVDEVPARADNSVSPLYVVVEDSDKGRTLATHEYRLGSIIVGKLATYHHARTYPAVPALRGLH